MKNLIVFLFLIYSSTFLSANKTIDINSNNLSEIKSYEIATTEYKVMIDSYGYDTCYVRVCWNESETRRRCSDWIQVPCDAEPELETKTISNN